nr:hypothetical protein [uncultured Enterobacter sp.]
MNTYSNVLNSRENTGIADFKRDLTAAVTNLFQAWYEIKKDIPKPFYEQAKVVISGKIGIFVSVINLSDKKLIYAQQLFNFKAIAR